MTIRARITRVAGWASVAAFIASIVSFALLVLGEVIMLVPDLLIEEVLLTLFASCAVGALCLVAGVIGSIGGISKDAALAMVFGGVAMLPALLFVMLGVFALGSMA